MKKLLFAAATLCFGIAIAQTVATIPETSHDATVAKNLVIFNTLVKELENTYVDSIRTDEAFEAAIGAMLNTVDPYTEYYAADDKEALMRMTTGSYGGIGAFIMTRDGNTYISEPIEGTPSYKAGVKAGDRILRIDSIDMTGKGSEQTTKILRGEPGTSLQLTVARPYVADSILTFDIVRERVQEKSVPYFGKIDDKTGYIRLTSFMENSPKEVREALENLRANGAESLILDLRSNGGGLVESAVEILGLFLPRGTEVLHTKGKTPASEKTYKTTRTPLAGEMPVAVLIDGNTASASEITAGAMQDLDRAVLIGERSFGKGLVQGTYPLPYDGLLKITTAKYYIPSGRLIQAMDYSRRNPDGSVARTPDSLTNEFLTRNGRKVRDGGGLVPDTTVKAPKPSRLLYNLVLNNQLFDFATKYAATHPSIPAPGDFEVTDEIFAEFVASVDTAKVYTDKIGRTMVSDMRETARTEGFATPEFEAVLDSLLPMVEPNLTRDLYNRRDEISKYLGEEIISRYYSQSGENEFSVKYDEEVALARKILNDAPLYDKMLGRRPK